MPMPMRPQGGPPMPGAPPIPGMGTPPPGGGMEGKIKSMRSIMNPIDVSMMKQDGEIDPNMTVIQLLEQLGIDPNGPATQFKDFAKRQFENANPLNKMKGLAGGGAAAIPPASGAAPPPDFDNLMRG